VTPAPLPNGPPGPGIRELVLGTRNAGKLRELADLLEPLGVRCRSLEGFERAVEVEETGETFAENAALKASRQAVALARHVLGEDSGLVVDALGGQPGVRSARYSDPGATDERNNALLLARLAEARGGGGRTARYECHMALADPSGEVIATASGRCEGRIAERHRGRGGFGYDPLFIVPEYHATFGELGPAVKAVISHRARALRDLVRVCRRLLPDAVERLTPHR
jgi:XTP/dITP diphosphohydrolase